MTKMKQIDIQSYLKIAIEDAVNFTAENISGERKKALDYYEAKSFGKEVDGR